MNLLVLCLVASVSIGIKSEEEIFTSRRLDGTVLGPYKVRDFSRFENVSVEPKKEVEIVREDGLSLGPYVVRSLENFRNNEKSSTSVPKTSKNGTELNQWTKVIPREVFVKETSSHFEELKTSSESSKNEEKEATIHEREVITKESPITDSTLRIVEMTKNEVLTTEVQPIPTASSSAVNDLKIIGDHLNAIDEVEVQEEDKQINDLKNANSVQRTNPSLRSLTDRIQPPQNDPLKPPHNNQVLPPKNDPVDPSKNDPLVTPKSYPDKTPQTLPPKSELVEPVNSCHSDCSSLMNQMKFDYRPSSAFIARGESLTLDCSVPFDHQSTVRMQWLFQGSNPPTNQCSLTPQDTIALCTGFAFVEHFIDSNLTTQLAAEKVILQNLSNHNTGYYMCLIEMTCNCSSSSSSSGTHVMDEVSKTQKITIHEENYALELGVLGGLVGVLVVILIVGAHLQRNRRMNKLKPHHYSSAHLVNMTSKDVLHAPILTGELDDSDSFDDDDSQHGDV